MIPHGPSPLNQLTDGGDIAFVSRVLAVGLFGVASVAPPIPAVGSAFTGSLLMAVSLARQRHLIQPVRPMVVRLAVFGTVAALITVGVVRGSFQRPEIGSTAMTIWLVGATLCSGLFVLGRAWSRRFAFFLGVALLAGLSIGVVIDHGGSVYGLDPYLSHEAAADALRSGSNPYTDAVRVPNGSPNAPPGAVIEGYSYPPVTLAAFTAADWLFGDPRWVSAIALVVVAVVVAVRSGSIGVSAGVIAILVSTPTGRGIVWSGWTEPVTLLLTAAAVLTWNRPRLAALLLGFALATKQYMVMLVPLLLLIAWQRHSWKRPMLAIGTAALTFIPFLVWSLDGLWSTLVVRPLGLEPRADSQSLSGALNSMGINVQMSAWVMLFGGLLVSWWIAHQWESDDTAGLVCAFALVLATVFLLSMAFTNYWWLVQWLVAMSAMLSIAPSLAPRSETLNPRTGA